jgi:uncharacterized membrane protein YfcA
LELSLLNFEYALSGLLGGFLVGLTGVGGGSIMTPLLVLVFGIAPSAAVGTDLLYASITKASGVPVHSKKGHVDWAVVGWLSLGSLPASGLTLVFLQTMHTSVIFEAFLKKSVGIALVITALAILWKASRRGVLSFTGGVEEDDLGLERSSMEAPLKQPIVLTVITGIVLGCLVTLSSIGAGAVGTVVLVLLYPRFPITRIVGTDIAHAVPLTLIAGLGHLSLGHVNFSLLLNLLLGSIPGVWLGSHASAGLSERWSRPILAILLLIIAAKMIGV